MGKTRGEEYWVSRCIENALPRVSVSIHDDGTKSGMYDLDLLRDGSRFGACEITAAADRDLIELWNLVNGGEGFWTLDGVVGGWILTLAPSARVQVLKKRLPGVLSLLENQGIFDVSSCGRSPVMPILRDIGIVRASKVATGHAGRVYFTIELPFEKSGGFVPKDGDQLVIWFEGWINTPDQVHNIDKLLRSGAEEKHLFVILPGFSAAPFSATDVLMRPNGPLPIIAPTLPSGITHLWMMSTWDTGDVFFWSPERGWQRHEKVRGTLEALRDGHSPVG